MDTTLYPKNWDEISLQVKEEANWQCTICGHPHDPKNNYCLTTAHLVPIKALCEKWNLIAACQRCHLRFEKSRNGLRVVVKQMAFHFYQALTTEQMKAYAARIREEMMKSWTNKNNGKSKTS